jgi:hypothetical protein
VGRFGGSIWLPAVYGTGGAMTTNHFTRGRCNLHGFGLGFVSLIMRHLRLDSVARAQGGATIEHIFCDLMKAQCRCCERFAAMRSGLVLSTNIEG